MYKISLYCLLLSSTLVSDVNAAEWLAEPRLTVGSTYNDNITFRTADEIDATSTTLSAGLNSQIKEQLWAVNLDANVRSAQYSGVTGSDSNNVFLKLGSRYKTELHSLNLDADYERNTTFDEDFDTQLPANGLLEAQTEREKVSFTPGWSWQMTESWSLQALLQSTEIKYDEANSLDVSDSASDSGELRARYNIDEVSDITFSVSQAKTERDQNKRETGSYEYENTNYQLSYKYQLSENSTFNIGLGRRETVTLGTDVPVCSDRTKSVYQCFALIGPFQVQLPIELINTDSIDNGDTYSISYDYNQELTSYSIALNQSVKTSSNGYAQEVEDFTIRYNHQISEKVSAGLILNASRSTSVDSVSVSEDRDAMRIEPSFSWRFSKDSRLTAGYRYRKQTYSLSDVNSDANSIYVNLSFFWPKLMSSY